MGVKIAHALGAHVVVFTTSPNKKEDAFRLGANEVVVSRTASEMQKHAGSFDFILPLRRDGNITLVGAPEKPLAVSAFDLIFGRRSLSGSPIGGIPETQEMLDFCGAHNITADVEVIPIQKVNEAYERLLKSDVKYRFSMDMASLKSEQSPGCLRGERLTKRKLRNSRYLMKYNLWYLVLVLTGAAASAGSPESFDSTQWQGPHRNAISKERGLLKDWPKDGPSLAWKITGLGGGYGCPSVAAGRIFGMSSRGDDEVVWALSEKDGKELWVVRLGPAVKQQAPQGKEGPACTPTVDGELLYV